MQKIGNLVNLNQVKTCSSVMSSQETVKSTHTPTLSPSNAPQPNRRKCVDLMFSRFAAVYGHVWRSQFKSEEFLDFAKKEWLDTLSVFDSDILLKAIVHCRESLEMPPTLPQMFDLCRKIKKRNDFFVANPNFKAAKREIVAFHIKRCRALLTQ